jgi:hypothetical protein
VSATPGALATAPIVDVSYSLASDAIAREAVRDPLPAPGYPRVGLATIQAPCCRRRDRDARWRAVASRAPSGAIRISEQSPAWSHPATWVVPCGRANLASGSRAHRNPHSPLRRSCRLSSHHDLNQHAPPPTPTAAAPTCQSPQTMCELLRRLRESGVWLSCRRTVVRARVRVGGLWCFLVAARRRRAQWARFAPPQSAARRGSWRPGRAPRRR